MQSLETVKEVFYKYAVNDPTMDVGSHHHGSNLKTGKGGDFSSAIKRTGTHVDPQGEPAFIPRCNMAQALWDLEINPVFTDLDEMIHQSDLNADGKIDLAEFKSFYLSMYREYAANPQRALTTFMRLDENGNGFLARTELWNATCGGPGVDNLSEDEFDEFWIRLHRDAGNEEDLDEYGEMAAAEFVVAMCPNTTPEELNPLLAAYGLPTNAEMYCLSSGGEMKRRLNKKTLEERKRKKKEEEEARRRAEEDERKAREQAEADEEARKQADAEEEARQAELRRQRERDAEEKRKADEERKRKEEEERKKKAAEKKEEKPEEKKEGGCCVIS